MPPAIVAIASAAAAYGTTTALVAAGWSTFAAAMIGGVVATAASYVGTKLFGLDQQTDSLSNRSQAITANSVGNVTPISVVYGRVRLAGARAYATSKTADGSDIDNNLFYMVLVFGEGGSALDPERPMVESITGFWFDDEPADSGRFSQYTGERVPHNPDGTPAADPPKVDLYEIQTYLGADNQLASTVLMTAAPDEWTVNHRLRGLAYAVVRLEMPKPNKTGDIPWSGIPTVSAEVKGRKVYDPRDAAQDKATPSTWTWSDNPALCVLDYLRDDRYGKGLHDADVDWASFSAAANYCDELVVVSPTLSQKRYTCNGCIETDRPIIENLKQLLTCCRGSVVWSAGLYGLLIDGPFLGTRREYNESHAIGSWDIRLGDRASRFSQVTANFINPERLWQPDVVVVASADLRADDAGERLEANIDLPFTIDTYMAQRLAGVMLKQSRNQIAVTMTGTQEWVESRPGDVVKLTHATPGWSGKAFRILGMELGVDARVKVALQEYDERNYDLTALAEDEIGDATELPSPFKATPPTGLVLESGEPWALVLGDGSIQARIHVSWTASRDVFVDGYELWWRLASETVYQTAMLTEAQTEYLINAVQAGEDYYIAVRSRNSWGAVSAWLSGVVRAEGSNLVPNPVTNLTGTFIGRPGVELAWTLPTDADLVSVKIYRYSGATFEGPFFAAVGTGWIDGNPNPDRPYYAVAVVDRNGLVSGGSSVLVSGIVPSVLLDGTLWVPDPLLERQSCWDISPGVTWLPSGGPSGGQCVKFDKLANGRYIMMRRYPPPAVTKTFANSAQRWRVWVTVKWEPGTYASVIPGEPIVAGVDAWVYDSLGRRVNIFGGVVNGQFFLGFGLSANYWHRLGPILCQFDHSDPAVPDAYAGAVPPLTVIWGVSANNLNNNAQLYVAGIEVESADTEPLETHIFRFGDGSAAVTAGNVLYAHAQVAGRVTGWRVVADVACTATLSVWLVEGAATVPVAGDEVTTGFRPALAAADSASGDTDDWSGDLVRPGHVIAVKLETRSGGSAKSVTLSLVVEP